MLFNPKRGQNIFKTHPELESIAEFEALNDKQMKTLIYFADYKSPFRQRPKDDRFRLAAIEAGYKVDSQKNITLEVRARELYDGKIEKWNDAYKKYMVMQHNEDMEMLALVDMQLENIRLLMGTPTDDVAELEKRNKLINSLPDLRTTKAKLAASSGLEDYVSGAGDTPEDTGKRQLSLLDRVVSEQQQSPQE